MTKYDATSKKPEAPKARQVRVPNKKAAAIPEIDRPVTRIGEPTVKMRRLLRREDSHVGGEDWRISSSPETACWSPDSGSACALRVSIFRCLDLEFELRFIRLLLVTVGRLIESLECCKEGVDLIPMRAESAIVESHTA